MYKAVAYYGESRQAGMSKSPKKAVMMATRRGKPDRIVLFKNGQVISGGQEERDNSHKTIIRKGDNYVEDQTERKRRIYYS